MNRPKPDTLADIEERAYSEGRSRGRNDVLDVLTELLENLHSLGFSNATSPGLHIAQLSSTGEFYVAIHSYAGTYGNGRKVEFSVKNANLELAMAKAKLWVDEQLKTPSLFDDENCF